MVNAQDDMVTLKGRVDVNHIPRQPLWLFIVRWIQLLLALLVLALSAYAGTGYIIFYGGYSIGIFSFIWTLFFFCYIEITTFWFPGAYNKYAHLILECLCVIFWLSTFGSLAAVAAAWGYCYGGTECDSSPWGATKAAAALGAIEWVLFIKTLAVYSFYLHRHRLAEQQARIQNTVIVEQHRLGNFSQQPVNSDARFQQTNMA